MTQPYLPYIAQLATWLVLCGALCELAAFNKVRRGRMPSVWDKLSRALHMTGGTTWLFVVFVMGVVLPGVTALSLIGGAMLGLALYSTELARNRSSHTFRRCLYPFVLLAFGTGHSLAQGLGQIDHGFPMSVFMLPVIAAVGYWVSGTRELQRKALDPQAA